jgi:transposase
LLQEAVERALAVSIIGSTPRAAAECTACSLRQDLPAVRAALALPWSTSPVEGQINRLRTIKRQMHGRAGFDPPH